MRKIIKASSGLLDLKESAAILKVTPRQLRVYAKRGLIAHSRPPGRRVWWFTQEALDEFTARYSRGSKEVYAQ
jgi:Helix-turn-helix domain